MLDEVRPAGHEPTTLVLLFSDNGIPYPAGKTNLLEHGQNDPLVIYQPGQSTRGRTSRAVVSSLDFLPTILDWANVSVPAHTASVAALTGGSLLPWLDADPAPGAWRDTAFGSHQFHSLYAYYPTRSMRTRTHRLIHNLNYNLKFPILEDVANTEIWRALSEAGEAGNGSTTWAYNYSKYMHRPEWQLYDAEKDPLCLTNLAGTPEAADTLRQMQAELHAWRKATNDPWLPCNPATPSGAAGEPWLHTHSTVCAF
jgi:N-sulfoglucosamine sulfohydrolase